MHRMFHVVSGRKNRRIQQKFGEADRHSEAICLTGVRLALLLAPLS